jgi:hypothetical protein
MSAWVPTVASATLPNPKSPKTTAPTAVRTIIFRVMVSLRSIDDDLACPNPL